MSAPGHRKRKARAVIATLMIVLAYLFAAAVAFTGDAVFLTILIPAALGCLAIGVLVWVFAVLREAEKKGVL